MPVCKAPILPSPQSKPPYMPMDTLPVPYQPPKIEDEPVDVDAIEPDLNTDFEKKPHIRKELSMRHTRNQERNAYMNHLNCTHRLTARF